MENRMDEFELLVAEEELIADAQMYIHLLMKRNGVSQSDLARALGISKAAVSQMLGPDANLTLRRLARVAAILGEHVTVCDRNAEEVKAILFDPRHSRTNRKDAWSAHQEAEFAELALPQANDNYEPTWAFDELDIEPTPKPKPRLTAA